jgi:hypothetical protein
MMSYRISFRSKPVQIFFIVFFPLKLSLKESSHVNWPTDVYSYIHSLYYYTLTEVRCALWRATTALLYLFFSFISFPHIIHNI